MCVEILMPDGETLVTIRDAVKVLPVIISRQRVYNGDLDTCLMIAKPRLFPGFMTC